MIVVSATARKVSSLASAPNSAKVVVMLSAKYA